MKNLLFIFLAILCPFFVSGQNLEVEGGVIADSIDVSSGLIKNVANPISAQDAATKAYVDLLETTVGALQDHVLELQLIVGIRDIDGNMYEVLNIGTQTWMKENLRVTKYNDGTPLLEEQGGVDWGNLTTPAYCWHTNDSVANASPYGALYNYYAVADTNSLNVCPVGWHVPTDAEWTTLTTYLGGLGVAGGKMKEAGLAHWTSPNTGATNESGFTGLPGGFRFSSGSFGFIGSSGNWWSSTESGSFAWWHYLFYDNDNVIRDSSMRQFGFSVRCLSD